MVVSPGKLRDHPLRRILLVSLVLVFAHQPNFGQPPVISQQPASLMVGTGVSAVFTVSAFPSIGATRQWFHEDQPIANATNAAFRIENVALADAGRYSATVSNAFGTVKSQAASLRVVPAVRLERLTTITTPRPPVGRAPNGFAMWVKTKGNRAYIADRYVQIYDVTDPAAPIWLSTYGNFDSSIYSLFPFDHFVAATDGSYLLLLDATDPAKPVRLSRTRLLATGLDITVAGNLAYVATTAGLEIYDLSNLAKPSLIGQYKPATVYTVTVQNGFAYLGATSRGALIVDVSNPAEPTLAAELGGSWVDTVRTQGNLLYTAGEWLATYDVSDPEKPVTLGKRRFLGHFGSHGMDVFHEFVFTGQRSTDLSAPPTFSVFDVGNPSDVAEVSQLPGTSFDPVESVEIADPFIYIAVSGKVEIFRRLSATTPPVITAEVGNVSSVLDSPARLQASASGGEHLSWQWARNGAELPGETNRTLFLPGVTAEQTGTYSVTVGNSVGSVISAGSLALIDPPPLNLTIQRGPRLELQLPEGFQSRLEASSDLGTWTEIWSGQATSDLITPRDSPGNLSYRFYRLRFGLK